MSVRITLDLGHACADFDIRVDIQTVASARRQLNQAVQDATTWLDTQERNAKAREDLMLRGIKLEGDLE